MRLPFLLVVVACGGSTPATFAPVAAVLDFKEYPGHLLYVGMSATRQLNPNCRSNCEFGDAFPDGGGSREWFGLEGGGGDAGVRWGAPQDVMIGAVVVITVGGASSATCKEAREVGADGFVVTATVHSDATCNWSFP